VTADVREAPEAERFGAFRRLGRNRDFRLMWIGQATSELGSSITNLALPLLVFALSGSAALAGLLGTISYLTMWLAQIPGGYVADMFDRRRVMLWCDLGRAVLVGVAAVAVFTGLATPVLLLVVVGAATFLWSTFGAAEQQAIRLVVPSDQLPEAIGINQARGFAMDLVGPVLCGWLFTLDHALPLSVDVITFMVSLACVWFVRTSLRTENRPTVGRLLPDVGRGWTELWRNPFLRAKTAYSIVTNFAVSMLLFVLILSSAGGVLIGLGVSIASAAGLAGSLLAPAAARLVPMRALLVGVALLRAGSLAVALLVGASWALVPVLATVILLGPMAGAALAVAQIRLVPGEVLGRAGGASGFLSSALQPVAPLAAGLLVQYLAPGPVKLVLIGAFLLVALVAAVVPGLSRR